MNNAKANRGVLVTWSEPTRLYAARKLMKPIDLFRAVRDGSIPIEPCMALLGAELVLVEPGKVALALLPAEQHLDHGGAMQAGILTALTDTAAGYAIHTRVPAGVSCATLELQVSLLHPVTLESGHISCVGRAIRVGARTATAEARVIDAAGNLCALMSTTFIVLPPAPV
jgi:uncharacterized protein (TIGR00369 family)